MKRQLAYILARQQVNIETEDEVLAEILNNTKLSENFKRFGKELNVTDPKSLEDIYKSHLENTRSFFLHLHLFLALICTTTIDDDDRIGGAGKC